MYIPFTKAHGTGNDFIILYSEDLPFEILKPELIQKLCHRRQGIGADGLLLLSPHSTMDFKMDYYNSDGTWETFCGNGSRCAAMYMYKRGLIRNQSSFEGGDGPHDILIQNDNQVQLRIKPPKYKSERISSCGFNGFHIDSGARHFVIEADEVNQIDVFETGRQIRHSDEFSPKGINVNFFSVCGKNSISVRTYEKGVENVMLSCGSGSVASAFHASNVLDISSPIIINVPGGQLQVKFNSKWDEVWLQGPAILLFVSSIHLENL